MTCREKLKLEHPECVGDQFHGGCCNCPSDYGYLDDPSGCRTAAITCAACWDREIPEEKVETIIPLKVGGVEPKRGLRAKSPVIIDELHEVPNKVEALKYEPYEPASIKDSGDRTEFATGAVRDMREGKGRCDLMPLDVVARIIPSNFLVPIASFQKSGQVDYLYDAVKYGSMFENVETMFLEVAKHFEEGAKKYGENNWQKGIPTKCYIDSAVRHYLKWLRGDKDEPHDRAFCWNILCCIWTCENMPELNDYKKNE